VNPTRRADRSGGTDVTSICKGAYLDLMAYLGRDPGQVELVNPGLSSCPGWTMAFLDEVIRSDTRQCARERWVKLAAPDRG